VTPSRAKADRRPLVFVTVGTDHHPFDRLTRWVDGWLEDGAGERVRCLVQFGTSRPPGRAETRDYLQYHEVQAAMGEAVAVVTHGGPGSVMTCRWAGKVPVVVPRRHDLGEHVDDHQLAFARRMAAEGELEVAEDEDTFRRILERALAEPEAYRVADVSQSSEPAVERFGNLVGRMLEGRSRAASRRVLYIGGWGRSGSTILDRMLGQVPGFVAVGELRELWQRGLVENRSCGCGAAFRDCPFWTEVGQRAFGGWAALDLDDVLRLRYSLDRGWSLPILSIRPGPVRRYTDILAALYGAIGQVSEADVIVDSSKLPSHAMLARLAPSVDLRMVHLVRDSRGVVYSWEKSVKSDEASADPRLLERYGPTSASARYVYYNGLTALARRLGVPYLRVRYEDLIAGPRAGLDRILRHAGVPVTDLALSFLGDGEARLRPNHTVDGNPVRFAVGGVPLRIDDEWRRRMPSRRRLMVTALTSPSLLRYGYRLGVKP
jgi:UDP-N-acetylglucosamine transferase subunit ALG13